LKNNKDTQNKSQIEKFILIQLHEDRIV
jgi:hypothetical protein